jgi:hypothetical protein
MDNLQETDRVWIYQIKVEGRLGESWSGWFSGLTVAFEATNPDTLPVTILTGAVADQAALRGILTKLWNLNLSLISVVRLQEK